MPAEREGGFTLLEVLVALAIAGIGLGTLLQGGLTGLRGTEAGGRTQEALARARSRLAAVGQGPPLAAGETAGDDGGGYRWRVRVAPLASRPAPRGQGSERGAALYDVRVTVTWGREGESRAVALATRRLGPAPPAPP